MTTAARHPYFQIQPVLLSLHDKTPLIANAATALQWQIRTDEGFDTDSLGTFSRDIPRLDTQQQTALHKAKLACQRNQVRFGLGSEGSVQLDPQTGLLPIGVEMVVFYDAMLDLAVTGIAQGPSPLQRWVLRDETALQQRIATLQMPAQQYVLFAGELTANSHTPPVAKGIASAQQLQDLCAPLWPSGAVTLETDYRAHACPARRPLIHAAACDLISRLQSQCPQCQAVDFSIRQKKSGLPCAACHAPTPQVKAWVRQCQACGFAQDEPVATSMADPQFCPFCNP